MTVPKVGTGTLDFSDGRYSESLRRAIAETPVEILRAELEAVQGSIERQREEIGEAECRATDARAAVIDLTRRADRLRQAIATLDAS